MRDLKKAVDKWKWDINLTCPESWLLKLSVKSPKAVTFLCVFVVFGAIFQQKYRFPCFYPFVGMFLFIGLFCLFAERYYCKAIQEVTAALRHQECILGANRFITTWGTHSPVFVIAPIATLLVFGIGGCLMFGAIELTPTFIWVMLLFSVVVAISIVGYSQYICLAVYIAKLSHCAGRYKGLVKRSTNYIPAGIPWIQELTKLSHIYRATFFTIGCTYILAFSGFCFWPDMEAKTNSICFYILWGIIFVAIVLTFPIISTLEHKWIKQIIQQLKESYIYDLQREQKLLKESQPEQLISVIVSISARQILDSKDYPLRSVWGVGYAMAITIINFVATITTIFTDTLPFINDLQQFFL